MAVVLVVVQLIYLLAVCVLSDQTNPEEHLSLLCREREPKCKQLDLGYIDVNESWRELWGTELKYERAKLLQ